MITTPTTNGRCSGRVVFNGTPYSAIGPDSHTVRRSLIRMMNSGTTSDRCERCGDEVFGPYRGELLCAPCQVDAYESEDGAA